MATKSTIPFKDFVAKQILKLGILKSCNFNGSLNMSLEQHENKHKDIKMKTNIIKWQEHLIPTPQKQVLGILKAYLKESQRIQKMEAHEKCSRIKLILHYNSVIIWDLRLQSHLIGE
jgi:hypothetical protein